MPKNLSTKLTAAFFALFIFGLPFLLIEADLSITRTMSVSGMSCEVMVPPVRVKVIFALPSFPSPIHSAFFSTVTPFFVTVTTFFCEATLSAASADIGRTLTSISTASTMLKMRFFMFFFPPVSNFLMCFDAFLSAKVGCVSLYQNFSRMQVPKHPLKKSFYFLF